MVLNPKAQTNHGGKEAAVQCGQANSAIAGDAPLFKGNLDEGVQHVLVLLRLDPHLLAHARVWHASVGARGSWARVSCHTPSEFKV